jgi:Mg-chelatase subunit ChlD
MSNHVQLSAITEYDQVVFSKHANLYTMASIKAPLRETQERESRAPINIVCVIDKSGSMAGNKMNLVKETLKFMVEQLKSEDQLAIVAFDTHVDTHLQFMKMDSDNKKKAQRVISELKPGSQTNLSGGLFEGLEMLKKITNSSDVASLLLFTDGQCNQGITQQGEIVKGVNKYLSVIGKSVSIFTFGFGADHDSNMLRTIAESGYGMYYFLERSDEIPQSFADCLGGLLSVVAQNIKLKIETLDNGVTIKALHSLHKRISESPNCIELSLGDLYSEEQRDVILEVYLPELRSAQDMMEVVKFTLNYFDVFEGSSEELETTAVVSRPEVEPVNMQVNYELDRQRNRVEMILALQKGRESAEKGDLDNARKLLQAQQFHMMCSPSARDNMVQAINSEVLDLLNNMVSPQQYSIQGMHQMNSTLSSITQQRSNKKSSAFTTNSKSRMQEKWEEKKQEKK